MGSKTISLEEEAYRLLKSRKLPSESFSQLVRRMEAEQPALTAGELLAATEPLKGVGAGPRRRRAGPGHKFSRRVRA